MNSVQTVPAEGEIRNLRMAIPKTVHYCWFGKEEMPALQQACLATWTKHLPDFEIKRWDESNAPMEIPFVREHYARKEWAFVSDFVRLYALVEEGGIFLDTDMEVVRNFDPLLEHAAFVAFEREGRLTNGACGGRRGHPFFRACLEYMTERFERGLPYMISPEVTTAVYSQTRFPDVALLPKKSFYPYNPYDPADRGVFMFADVTPETYAVHHWAKSWKMDWRTRVRRLWRKCIPAFRGAGEGRVR